MGQLSGASLSISYAVALAAAVIVVSVPISSGRSARKGAVNLEFAGRRPEGMGWFRCHDGEHRRLTSVISGDCAYCHKLRRSVRRQEGRSPSDAFQRLAESALRASRQSPPDARPC
jgi:hypothetical protein